MIPALVPPLRRPRALAAAGPDAPDPAPGRRDGGTLPARAPVSRGDDARELRLLIVDDDFLFSEMLPRLLQREVASPALRITAVRTPEEARRVAHAQPFDVVLCDFDLRARSSGLDVLSDVVDSPGRPFRILISGHSPREIPAGPGAYDAFLDKPMTLREVVPQLAALLEERLGIRFERRGR